MAHRDTGTGGVLEAMVLPALERGGYAYKTQVVIGRRPGGRRHKVDIVATDSIDRTFLISLKWQQTPGTVEQKVPFEVICLAEAVQASPNDRRAYLVLGGHGWTLREFYTSGGLKGHLVHAEHVRIVDLETFVGLANASQL
jgi:PD-(D/E)XK nuclease superfamily domain